MDEATRPHGKNTLPNLKGGAHGELARVLDVAGRCHTGKVRDKNDDHFLVVDIDRIMRVRCSSLDPSPQIHPSRGTVLMVADGMGGHGDGELASAVAIDQVVAYLANAMPWAASHHGRDEALHAGFQNAVTAAQSRIRAVAERRGADPSMGTTLTVVYVLEGEVFVAHVGDSRAYLFRPGYGLCRLTHDHTLGELLRSKGVDGSNRDHVLTQSVGGSDAQPKVEAHRDRLQPGDRLLLCTDGVHGFVSDDQLGAILGAGTNADAAADAIRDAVLATEARDNLTAVVAQVG